INRGFGGRGRVPPDIKLETITHEAVLKSAGVPKPLSRSAILRQTMVDRQIRTYDVTDQRILARMLEVPREQFLPADQAELAYSDPARLLNPAEAGKAGRWLLAPLVLARLIQGAQIKPTDNVLDIAAGTGYSSALLAGIAARVHALESEEGLFE